MFRSSDFKVPSNDNPLSNNTYYNIFFLFIKRPSDSTFIINFNWMKPIKHTLNICSLFLMTHLMVLTMSVVFESGQRTVLKNQTQRCNAGKLIILLTFFTQFFPFLLFCISNCFRDLLPVSLENERCEESYRLPLLNGKKARLTRSSKISRVNNRGSILFWSGPLGSPS